MSLLIPLLILALPIACISWTVTHEEIFRELREYATERSTNDRSYFSRKFFYLFTCEYCFSHYVTLAFVWATHYTLFFDDWRGYVISIFALVFVANAYMNIYSKMRVGIKMERKEIEKIEEDIKIAESAQQDNWPL